MMDNICGENGQERASKILVDYLSYTISLSQLYDYEDPKDGRNIGGRMQRKLFLPSELPWQERKGLYGYASTLWYDGIVFAWGGADTVLVQMSGTGCRTWETLHPGLTWERWLRYLHETYNSLHISRLDIAYDTYGLLKLKVIQQYTRDNRYISRWRNYLIQEGTAENSVIWGSSKSDFRLRIYDKTQERSVKGGIDPSILPQGWVRCEFQLRNDAAAAFWREWSRSGSIGDAYRGIMCNQLLYCSKHDGIHRDRAVVAPWWRKLLGDAPRLKMSYSGGKAYNYDSLMRYAHQFGPSAKAIIECNGGDPEALFRLIGGCRLNDRQAELVRSTRKVPVDALAADPAYKLLIADIV